MAPLCTMGYTVIAARTSSRVNIGKVRRYEAILSHELKCGKTKVTKGLMNGQKTKLLTLGTSDVDTVLKMGYVDVGHKVKRDRCISNDVGGSRLPRFMRWSLPRFMRWSLPRFMRWLPHFTR